MAALSQSAPASYGATTPPASLSPTGSWTGGASYDWSGSRDAESASALLRTGSIFSSVMNLCACALGASMLSLPYAMSIAGPAAALVLLTLLAFLSFAASNAIVSAGGRARRTAYADIVTCAYGAGAGSFASALLSTALFVAAVSYICGLSDLIPHILPWTASVGRSARVLAVLAALFPLTLVGSLAAFGAVSGVAVAGCYVQAAAIAYELLLKTDEGDVWSVPATSELLRVDFAGLVYVSPMLAFVYAYHYVLTETLDELSDPTPARITTVNALTVAVLYACYLPLAIAGYLNYSGVGVPSNMLTKLNENSAAVVIARAVIASLLAGTYALFIIPLRRSLESAVFGARTASFVDPRRFAIAAALAVTVAAAALALPDLSVANTIAGGAIALVIFFFPGLLVLHGQFGKAAGGGVGGRSGAKIALGGLLVVAGAGICFVGLFGGMIFNFRS